jgi:hypothetical protein
MHSAPLTPDPRKDPPRPTKTEVRGGVPSTETKERERATSGEEEAMLLGGEEEDRCSIDRRS